MVDLHGWFEADGVVRCGPSPMEFSVRAKRTLKKGQEVTKHLDIVGKIRLQELVQRVFYSRTMCDSNKRVGRRGQTLVVKRGGRWCEGRTVPGGNEERRMGSRTG